MTNIFGWDNYEENPSNMIGVDTIHTQKDAVRAKVMEGAFTGNVAESFFTNNDEFPYPQLSTVLGESPKVVVYGKGLVPEGIIIPDGYDEVTDPTKIPTTSTETVKLALTNSEVANAMTDGSLVYEDVIVSGANVNNNVYFNATDEVVMDQIIVTGEKGSSNGKVNFKANDATIKNISMGKDPNTTAYNLFEGSQDKNYDGLKTMTVENVVIENPNITHNIVNIYTPAQGAVINVKDCKFDLTVDNSNVLRLANYLNSENVTVNFENVEWNYENGLTKNDWSWAGLVIFQPSSSDLALTGDYSKIATWKFNFKNCKYNGVKVTANNFGQHNQVVYMYDLNKSGAVSDPAAITGLTINFA